ncbi:MAG: hypothetical protein AAGF28_11760 [Pseudomonadota bacterium]
MPTIVFTVLGATLILRQIPVFESRIATSVIIVFVLAILSWQTVGTLRTITNDQRSYGAPMNAWLGYGALLTALVLGGLQITDQAMAGFSKRAALEAQYRPVLLPVSDDGTSAILSGDLDFKSDASLRATLEAHPTVRVVTLSSDGGLVFAARALAITIAEHGLDTRVEATCQSACTIPFMAGMERSVSPSGRLGFHRYRFLKAHQMRKSGSDDEQDKDIAYFRKRGVAADFLKRAFQTPHTSIWYPSLSLMRTANVVNDGG